MGSLAFCCASRICGQALGASTSSGRRGRRRAAARRTAVGVEPLGLPVGRVGAAHVGALVPVEPEPAQGVEDLLLAVLAVARPVGVLDAQDELAALLARERQVEQRHVRRADVRVAGGRRARPRAAGPGRSARRQPRATTGLVSVPMPSIARPRPARPASTGPTPAGVPVRMTSPGSSVNALETCEIERRPRRASCRRCGPSCTHLAVDRGGDPQVGAGRGRSRSTARAGRSVSKPLARAHWPSLRCRSRAVTSLATV